jgi:hypothetical protein
MLDADRRSLGRELNSLQWVIQLRKDMLERSPTRELLEGDLVAPMRQE